MKLFVKIGCLKFPIQSLLEGYDNLFGGFLIFNGQYFWCLMGFYKKLRSNSSKKIIFHFQKGDRK
jgi:hypothetical protein